MVDAATAQLATGTPRFKGWQVVAGAFVVLFVSSGLGFYALAVYLNALTDDKGFTVGQVSFANFLFFLTGGAFGLLIGRLIAQRDIRKVMAAGGVVAGVTLALVGRVTELWQLYALYVVFALGWAACGLVPGTTVVTRWFHRRRSQALSIASTGLSVGGIVITPIVKTLIEDVGMETAMPWLGAAFVLGVVPAALFLVIPWPQHIGQHPDGDPAPLEGSTVSGTDFHVAVHSRYFIAVTAAYVLVMAAQVGGISHLVKLGSGRLDKPTASLILSVMAGASVVARLAGGWVVSRVPMTAFTAALAGLQGLALLSIGWVDGKAGLLLLAVAFGITVGNLLMLQPLLLAEAFGVRDYPRIYSRSQFVSTAGVACGPLLLGVVHDAVDGYEFPYTLAATMSLLGMLGLLAAGPTHTAAERAEATARARPPRAAAVPA